jgi:hypothetical protein
MGLSGYGAPCADAPRTHGAASAAAPNASTPRRRAPKPSTVIALHSLNIIVATIFTSQRNDGNQAMRMAGPSAETGVSLPDTASIACRRPESMKSCMACT